MKKVKVSIDDKTYEFQIEEKEIKTKGGTNGKHNRH